MTRLERLQAQDARAREKLAQEKAAAARTQAALREETQKRRHRRRYQVGALAEAAGLCTLDDPTLAGLFAVLAQVSNAPTPVALLEALVAGSDVLEERVEGMAHAAHGVSPCRAD